MLRTSMKTYFVYAVISLSLCKLGAMDTHAIVVPQEIRREVVRNEFKKDLENESYDSLRLGSTIRILCSRAKHFNLDPLDFRNEFNEYLKEHSSHLFNSSVRIFDSIDDKNSTLHFACRHGEEDVVLFLVQAIDNKVLLLKLLFTTNALGYLPLHEAVDKKITGIDVQTRKAITQLILTAAGDEAGRLACTVDQASSALTASQRAMQNDFQEIAELLVKYERPYYERYKEELDYHKTTVEQAHAKRLIQSWFNSDLARVSDAFQLAFALETCCARSKEKGLDPLDCCHILQNYLKEHPNCLIELYDKFLRLNVFHYVCWKGNLDAIRLIFNAVDDAMRLKLIFSTNEDKKTCLHVLLGQNDKLDTQTRKNIVDSIIKAAGDQAGLLACVSNKHNQTAAVVAEQNGYHGIAEMLGNLETQARQLKTLDFSSMS